MRFSLQTKILVGYVAFTLVVAGAVYVYLNTSLRDDVSGHTRQQLLHDARLIRSYLENAPLPSLSPETIDPIADRLGEQCGARVTVVTDDGVVAGDSSIPLSAVPLMENHGSRPEILEAIASGTGNSIRYSNTLETDMAYVAVPFRTEQARGVVRVALPLQQFRWIESHIWKIVLAALGIGLVLSVVLSWGTERLVSRPIERMTEVARRQAAGDFAVTASAPTHVELSSLAAALNEMAAQSKERLSRIREENAQLEAVLSGMAEGVMVTSAEGRILMVNPAFKRMMDVDAWCLNKRPIEVVRNHDLQSVVDAAIDSAPSLREDAVFDLTLEWNQRIFQVHLTPIRIGERLHGVVAVFHDVTELRRLEQVRKDFVANVSHELRTPLTSIKGYVETLLDGAMDDSAAMRRFMTSVRHHADRLQALVEDLLQLSRIESGRYEVEFTSCRLDRISERVAEIFAKQIEGKQLDFSLRFETDRPARGDPELMERALSNLVDNAVKYTEKGGSIAIGTVERDDEIILSVADTGPGIPSEALPRIFERFFRVDRARSRELGGTGLGLAIVRHTMELLNGKAWVESRLGEGATFYLSLPVWSGAESTGVGSTGAESTGAGSTGAESTGVGSTGAESADAESPIASSASPDHPGDESDESTT